jgi:endonuclease YncB( thermonuclease family)
VLPTLALLCVLVAMLACSPEPPTSLPPSPTPAAGRIAAEVVDVVDGDTIKTSIDGQVYTVRYIGVDTPETVAPGRPVEWMGPEASAANEAMVGGKTVYLEKDVSETDRYGRLLRYVYLADGTFVNAELARLGYAHAATFPPDVAYQDLFRQMEQEARDAGRGLWGPTPVATAARTTLPAAGTAQPAAGTAQPAAGTAQPAAGTAQPAAETTPAPAETAPPATPPGVRILAVDKVAEYVDLQNTGPGVRSLDGWALVSERGAQRCPLFGDLPAGETLRVWAMGGNEDGFHCGFREAIWNNSQPDAAVLYDEQGREVDRK